MHTCCMTSSVDDIITFDSTHDKTTSGVVYHHRPWITKQDQTISGVACHHHPWIAKLDMTPSSVAYHHGQWAIYTVRHAQGRWWHATPEEVLSFVLSKSDEGMTRSTSSDHVCCPRERWHAIISLGQHIRSNGVGCGMPSSLLDCTHT